MNNKFFKILRTLSPAEFREFGEFLRSPYFNESPKYVNLYEYLEKYFPRFESKEICKENLYRIFYKDGEYIDKKLRDRINHSLHLIKDFISFNNFRKDEFERRKSLLTGIRDKEENAVFEEEYKKLVGRLEDSQVKNEEYYYKNYQLSSIYRSYFESRTSLNDKARLHTKASEEIDYVLNFFLIVMLKEYSKIFNSEREVKIDYKLKFYEEIIQFISKEEKNFENVPLIALLYKFISLHSLDKDEFYVENLRRLLNFHKNAIDKDVYETFYIELYNYCKRMESHGRKEFGRVSFSLMKEMLEKDIFSEPDGFMSAHTYINLAATAIREGKIDWAESFINTYRANVRSSERINAYNYNLAVLYYIRGYESAPKEKEVYYGKALKKLSEVKSEDFYYATRIKNHELKIYYELSFTENLLSLLDSYSHYLSRNKHIPVHLKERYQNFVKYSEKLIRLKFKKKYVTAFRLREEIQKNNNIEYKGWLLQRLDELEKWQGTDSL